ncbi:MAG: endonuclease/exonuclease/phosphatase family protein [Lachnospiraceae bacterium]|jgi:endonuclease/exonuclease/phosphatase family metal-dependent hydrolase
MRGNGKKKKAPLGLVILRIVLIVLIIVLVLAAGLVLYLTVTEYKPASEEPVEVETEGSGESVQAGDELRIVTWNCGYGALGDNADFFMDGGSMVKTATKERVEQNLATLRAEISSLSPDITFLQEVDTDSARSYHIDEVSFLGEGGASSDFAYNYRVVFVPYPVPPMGKIYSGVATQTDLSVSSATRIALPCPFKWPVRVGNLKRCLLVNRVPVDGSSKELVLVNLHLEAYDDGEGKAAQTKVLCDFLKSEYEKGNYVIAGGDFNQTFSGTDTSMYPDKEGTWQCGILDESDFPTTFQFCQDSSTPTCRSLDIPYAGADHDTFQYYVIDGFIVSDNVEVQSCRTQDLAFTATDHNPVLMEVRLK